MAQLFFLLTIREVNEVWNSNGLIRGGIISRYGAVALVLVIGACDADTQLREEPNLVIWGPATKLTVDERNTADPDFELALGVFNFGLSPANSFKSCVKPLERRP